MLKPHRKTRTGCTQCKRRKVKCDEQKPSCANCNRNRLSCSFEFLTPLNSLSRAKPIFGRFQTKPVVSPIGLYPWAPKLIRELSGLPFDPQTEEILHHYITVLSISLGGNRQPSVWQGSMLKVGIAQPFLLYGIIAISALHLATLLPHRKYELQNFAVAQESAALPLFRASINTPTSESIHASFAFAGSVVYYVMALPEGLPASTEIDRCRIPSREEIYPHWFHTIRGMMAVLENHKEELSNGPFASILRGKAIPIDPSNNPDNEHLATLDDMLSSPSISTSTLILSPGSSPGTDLSAASMLSQDVRGAKICKEALEQLRSTLELTHSPNRAVYIEASLRIWPGIISQEFVEMIYERDPRALVILAYYCVLLKRNDRVWYLRGLGRGLLQHIWNALDEEWRPWIQWPIEQPIW